MAAQGLLLAPDVVFDVALQLLSALLDAAGHGSQDMARQVWDLGQARVAEQDHVSVYVHVYVCVCGRIEPERRPGSAQQLGNRQSVTHAVIGPARRGQRPWPVVLYLVSQQTHAERRRDWPALEVTGPTRANRAPHADSNNGACMRAKRKCEGLAGWRQGDGREGRQKDSHEPGGGGGGGGGTVSASPSNLACPSSLAIHGTCW